MLFTTIGSSNLYISTIPNYNLSLNTPYYKNTPPFLPLLIFLKHVFSDAVWHRSTNQACLIIDDPWLIEPYGSISYIKLLDQMKQIPFHTSIAFIPYNYDRSSTELVEFLKENTRYFSFIIHGNNHDHYEFSRYSDIPFINQRSDILQAMKRMEAFKTS